MIRWSQESTSPWTFWTTTARQKRKSTMSMYENTPYGHIDSNTDGTLTWRSADSEVNPALAGDRTRINLDTVHGCGTLRHLMRKGGMRKGGCEANAVTVEVECFETIEALGLPVNFDEYGVFVTTPMGTQYRINGCDTSGQVAILDASRHKDPDLIEQVSQVALKITGRDAVYSTLL